MAAALITAVKDRDKEYSNFTPEREYLRRSSGHNQLCVANHSWKEAYERQRRKRYALMAEGADQICMRRVWEGKLGELGADILMDCGSWLAPEKKTPQQWDQMFIKNQVITDWPLFWKLIGEILEIPHETAVEQAKSKSLMIPRWAFLEARRCVSTRLAGYFLEEAEILEKRRETQARNMERRTNQDTSQPPKRKRPDGCLFPRLAKGWRAYQSEKGTYYYVHPGSGKKQWECPDCGLFHRGSPTSKKTDNTIIT